jgi:hypothetical protein
MRALCSKAHRSRDRLEAHESFLGGLSEPLKGEAQIPPFVEHPYIDSLCLKINRDLKRTFIFNISMKRDLGPPLSSGVSTIRV